MEQFKSKIIVLCSFCQSMYKVAIELEGKSVTCSKCNKAFIADAGSYSAKKDDSLGSNLLFCKIALNYGFINENQLEKILKEFTHLSQTGGIKKIETLFLRSGFLEEKVVKKIQDIIPKWWIRQKEKQYAAAAVSKGLITKEKAKEILIEQAKIYNETSQIKRVQDFLAEIDTCKDRENIRVEKTVEAHAKGTSEQNGIPEKIKNNTPIEKPPGIKPSVAESPVDSGTKGGVTENLKVKPAQTEMSSRVPERDLKPEQEKSTAPEKPSDPVETKEMTKEKKETDEVKEPEEEKEAVIEQVKIDEETPAQVEEISDVETPIDDNSEEDTGQTVKKVNGLVLTISSDKVFAKLKAPDGIKPGTTVESIRQILEEEGILYGVVDDALIKGFLNSKVFREKPFKIAEGKPAKKGTEGNIKYHFETNPLKVGAVTESGDIDFKDRGEIPYVTEGELLAEVTPAVIGENGMDIYGHLIEVPVIYPVILRCEEGTIPSEDGLKVYAKTDGQPKLAIGDRLYVLSELKIPGDIGFETGHVEFQGNIVVGGTVQSDFTVKGANITATEVLAANIIATGDLIVTNGITGAKVIVEGNVKAKFINKSDIKAFGNIVVEKELIDSTVKVSGGCQVTRGKIIASEISSKQGVEAVEIGTEMSTPSKFRIGVDDHINDEVRIIEKQIENHEAFVEEIKSKIETATAEEKKTHLVIAELAQLQDRTQLEVNDLKARIDNFKKEGKDNEASVLSAKIDELNAVVKKADDDVNTQFDSQDELIETIAKQNDLLSEAVEKIGTLKHDKKSLLDWAKNQKTISYLKTSASLFAGTMIIGAHTSMVVKETSRNVKIREIKNPDMPEGWEMRRI